MSVRNFAGGGFARLTETILVLERPMKFYYPGVTGSQPDEGILLDESRLKFVVAREVALVQDFNRVLMFGDSMGGLHDLQLRLSDAVSLRSGLRTVE